tara:strand:- start:6929 stop:7303 length:375 start_codon:yes stop_codon:yes gene_type:complete
MSLTLLLLINNILPPIGNKYYTSVNIPLIGKQNIKYERTKKFISEITLSGKINEYGYIYFYNDDNDTYEYKLDNTLEHLLKKYKCSLNDPYYDYINDMIILNIQINLIKYSKKLTLINNQCKLL